ncbi:hypothetical protein BLX87_09845 [Bacillus sp. VT-16-64]|nr:hypothetical protein BLX87_09845 [Bacillus sp. VT-16-64]
MGLDKYLQHGCISYIWEAVGCPLPNLIISSFFHIHTFQHQCLQPLQRKQQLLIGQKRESTLMFRKNHNKANGKVF